MESDDKKADTASHYVDGKFARERRFKGRAITDNQRHQLQKFATDLALEYNFEDVGLLYAFLVRMWLLMETGSAVTVADDKVTSATDQPEFKPTRERLERLRDHLSEAVSILRDVPDNETLSFVLHLSDRSDAMDQQYEALIELLATCERAASLEGRAGRRPNEDWVREFCIECQRFWLVTGKTGTSIVFHTEFPTPITRWVEETYVELRRLKGQRDDLSKLKSAAKSLPAYRD